MGKSTSKYKNLKIRLEEIPDIINAWGVGSQYNNVKVEVPKELNTQTLNYQIDCDGKIATLAVFPTKGGVCTISPKFGKEKEISELIAEYIVSNCGTLADSNPYRHGLSINISKDGFLAFFELLKEQEDVIVIETREEEKKFFAKLRNERYRDEIAVSYYNTEKLVVQGKPLELFSLAVEILSDEYGLSKIVDAETKSAGLSINGDQIIEDMKNSLGNVYNFLGISHIAILSSAYIFYRTEIIVNGSKIKLDYSGLSYPASRVLEGYILKLLVNNNVLHDNDEHVGYYFRGEDHKEPLTLHSQYVSLIDNDVISNEINRLYKLYHRLRHPYAHASENDFSTAIITDRKQVDYNFKEIIETMNKSYDIIVSAKK